MKQHIKQQPHWFAALIIILGALIYFNFIATNRYVSEAVIVMESPDISPVSLNFSSLLSGTSGSGDLLLLREHLISVDMLNKIEAQLQLRNHFSDPKIDVLSRLNANASIEEFHKYFLTRLEVKFDDYAAVLRIRVQAFSPTMAQQIAQQLIAQGESHMNEMGRRLAEEQLLFIEQQAEVLNQRLTDIRSELLAFQNEYGLVSPTGTVESIFTVVAQLQGQLATLEAQRKALASFQSASAPQLQQLERQIKALKQQIELEKNKMTASNGDALNRVSADYETLNLKATFALELYSNTLLALENTRVEAARKLKQVSVLQYPTLAEYALEPKRFRQSLLFIIFAIFAAAIMHLTRTVIRDHYD